MSNRVRLRAHEDQRRSAVRDTAGMFIHTALALRAAGQRMRPELADADSPLVSHITDLVDQPICTCPHAGPDRGPQPLMLNLSLDRKCLRCVSCARAEIARHKKLWDADPDEDNRCDLCGEVSETGVGLFMTTYRSVFVVGSLCPACSHSGEVKP